MGILLSGHIINIYQKRNMHQNDLNSAQYLPINFLRVDYRMALPRRKKCEEESGTDKKFLVILYQGQKR